MSNHDKFQEIKAQLRETSEYKDAFAKELQKHYDVIDRRAISRVCPHDIKSYWNDPSGNNGGGWTCDVCGEDV